jgi:hypothetical protein
MLFLLRELVLLYLHVLHGLSCLGKSRRTKGVSSLVLAISDRGHLDTVSIHVVVYMNALHVVDVYATYGTSAHQ